MVLLTIWKYDQAMTICLSTKRQKERIPPFVLLLKVLRIRCPKPNLKIGLLKKEDTFLLPGFISRSIKCNWVCFSSRNYCFLFCQSFCYRFNFSGLLYWALSVLDIYLPGLRSDYLPENYMKKIPCIGFQSSKSRLYLHNSIFSLPIYSQNRSIGNK